MTDCADVCDVVIERLLSLGIKIDLDEQNHDYILEALAEVRFVRDACLDEEGEHLKAEAMALCDLTHNADCFSTNDLMRYQLVLDELERGGITVREIVTLAFEHEEDEESDLG